MNDGFSKIRSWFLSDKFLIMWNDNDSNFSSNVCRLCGSISDIAIPIFGKDGEKERLDLKIKKCLPIVVQEEDFKPKQVCINCVSKLEGYADFVDMCLDSELKFDSLLQQQYPDLKPTDSEENCLEQSDEVRKVSCLSEPTSEVVSLIEQTSKRPELSSKIPVTVSHEGGVIVLSKVDSEVSGQQRDECQDILVMVELKYTKDSSDSQQPTIAKAHMFTFEPQDSSVTKHSTQPFCTSEGRKTDNLNYLNDVSEVPKTSTITYAVEQPVGGGKTFTFAYSSDSQVSSASKSSAVTFTTEPQPIIVPKTHSFSFASDQETNSLSAKSQTLSYGADPNEVGPSKSHPIVFTTDAQPVPLTKDQLQFTADDVRPVALIKSNVLAYAPVQDGEGSVKHESVFISERNGEEGDKNHLSNLEEALETGHKTDKILSFPADPEIVLHESVTPDTILIDSPAETVPQFKENSRITKVTSSMKTEKPFPCGVCGKSFMRRTNLNVHMAVHTQNRPHQCEQCGKSYALKWDLTLHQRLHTGLFSCEFCNKAFSVRGKLERHRRTHTGERPFPCATCGKAFGDKRNLESHLRTHSGERPFKCPICSRSFRMRSHLTDHHRVHSEDTPFTCDTCGKSFKWKTNLNIHLKVHTGERFPCEECGREFGRRADLIKHQRSHTDDRPHACGICTKSYSDKAMLQKHLKSHSDHKPYSCDVCGKSFHFHWYLKTHKKIHYECKTFSCQLCGKAFNKKGNFMYHMKSCHSQEQQQQSCMPSLQGTEESRQPEQSQQTLSQKSQPSQTPQSSQQSQQSQPSQPSEQPQHSLCSHTSQLSEQSQHLQQRRQQKQRHHNHQLQQHQD